MKFQTVLISFAAFWLTSVVSGSRGEAKQLKDLNTGIFAIRSDLIVNLLAKELCSCIFVTGSYERLGPDESLKRCMKRAALPISESTLQTLVKWQVVDGQTVRIEPRPVAYALALTDLRPGIATFDRANPQYGCSLKFN